MTLELNKMTSGKTKAPRIEEGTYMARIASIIDLGIQPQTDWQSGEATDPKPRALFTWELPTETIEITNEDGEIEDKPRWMSKEYTLSNYEMSNLYKLLVALGKKSTVRLEELLNTECMVTIGSTINGNAKIVAVVPSPKGMPIPELANDSRFFDFDNPDCDLYETQPEWIREKIKDAVNYDGFAEEWAIADDSA